MKKLNLQLFANGSIVDYLKEQKQDSSYAARAKLAEENGIENYTGSAEQNTKLLSILQGNSSATTSSNAVTTSASGTSNTSTQLPVTGDGTQLAQSALSKTFTPSASYQSAMDYTNELLQQLSSGRTSYTDQIKSMMNQIMNREDFEYDADSDMLFQQYLNSSMATGKQAMQDTMGQAAALTGGYGSTYATSAGNQMYNAYIQDAYANLPEYYQLALDAYNMEGQEMYNQLAMLNEADATEYGRIYNAWNANNTYAQQLYQQEYGQYADEVKNAFDLAQFVNSNYWNQKDNDYRYAALQQSQDQYLAQYDADGDGKVSYEEANAGNKKTGNIVEFDGNTIDLDNIPKEVSTRASKYENNNELSDYLGGQVASGLITEEESDYLYHLYENPVKLSIAEQFAAEENAKNEQGEDYKVTNFTLVDKGGTNHFDGINRNAKVTDRYREEPYTMLELYEELCKTMDKDEAKKKVIALQEALGCN